ncbi:MAG TPA: phage major tail tube protein [Croceibacterium sp.]|nr:phage major tail tube protein [Solirubrobacterales bacterium]HYD23852.1 phage major tail tube protein [Croceibacterium sp.]
MLPAKLKNFNVFNDGASYLGVAKQLELPKLKMAGEEYRGAGMLAPVDVDLGLEKLELTATYGGVVVGVLRQMGLTRVDGAMLRYVGAYQGDQGGFAVGELVTRGRIMELDPGSAEAGEDTEWKVQSTLSYLKWTFNGTVEVEIDVLNGVYLIGGEDRMADVRAIIGGSDTLGVGGGSGIGGAIGAAAGIAGFVGGFLG